MVSLFSMVSCATDAVDAVDGRSELKRFPINRGGLFGATGYCAACNKVIPAFEMVMRAKSNVYHLECFACQQCNHRFCVGDRFYLWDNKILCEYDYEERLVFANIPFQPGGGIQGPPPSVDALKQQQIASGIHPSNNQGMLGQQRNNSSQQQMCPVSSYQGQMPVHHPQGQMEHGRIDQAYETVTNKTGSERRKLRVGNY
ncbi:unnamed protein product [Notodromas monacha]|uniref:LIM zinc-binding domain-containing protein n=1 Tax=Notodromas monacha TaxID=399045 RepID=A0A7R9BZ84_9CRUS|nr:unnamed protein product [Notodromas monacha]CAG0923044.1 unnamed protein product [Notodromas monacha]